MANRFKKNKVLADMMGYRYYIRGIEKSGKSTLFRDILLEKFGTTDKGLSMVFGKEGGHKAIDELVYEEIKEKFVDEIKNGKTMKVKKKPWQVFTDLVNDLVINKAEYGIEMLAFDTIDELIKIAMDEVLRLHNATYPSDKQAKSFAGTFGGYNTPYEKLEEILAEQIEKLSDSGYTIFYIGHTKIRTIKEKGMIEEGYNTLTSDLDPRCEAIFLKNADVVATIYVEKDLEGKVIKNTQRYIYFRPDGFVSAGSRFNGIPDKVEWGAEQFINAIETGIRNSQIHKMTEEELTELREKQHSEREKIAQEYVNNIQEVNESPINIERNKEIYSAIEAIWSKVEKEKKSKIKEILENNNMEKISDVENNPTSVMEEILLLVK